MFASYRRGREPAFCCFIMLIREDPKCQNVFVSGHRVLFRWWILCGNVIDLLRPRFVLLIYYMDPKVTQRKIRIGKNLYKKDNATIPANTITQYFQFLTIFQRKSEQWEPPHWHLFLWTSAWCLIAEVCNVGFDQVMKKTTAVLSWVLIYPRGFV